VLIEDRALEPLLAGVSKPGRYVGGEWNSVTKDWDGVEASLALVYPDVYEIGMSNLGLAILYDLVNAQPRLVAERVYTPWMDMEAAMRSAGLPLYSLETRRPLAAFDVVGFSLQHELTYTNVLTTLDLGGIPLLSDERTTESPLIIAGGSCAYNPEPMSAFMDAFVIGEGEEVLLELLAVVADWKGTGGRTSPSGRHDLLTGLAGIEGVYVPGLYRPEYGSDGRYVGLSSLVRQAPARILRRIVPTLGPVPTRPVVPSMRTVHNRAMVEIQRGCGHGCRFCQAGMVYRPIRERPAAAVVSAIDELLTNTGYDEVGLVSLSSSDHSGIAEIVQQTTERHRAERVSVSLPSLRIDAFSVQLAEMIQQTRKAGLTFAPEAGSQRLRDVINKGVSEEDLLRTVRAAFERGWNRLKLYFMLGLPTETDADVLEMARLIHAVRAVGREIRSRTVEVAVSVATFVPKPHTPFQWSPLVERETLQMRQDLLRAHTRARGIRVSCSEWDSTWLEALLSRGDRRMGPAIQRAWELGARMDAWAESFRPDIWKQAIAEAGLQAERYTSGELGFHSPLPWDHIHVGVSREFLWEEYRRALSQRVTPGCRDACANCGVLAAYAAQRRTAGDGAWGCP